MARHNYKDLLGALAERWWDTTNTFHFPWGEMTMTPTDFSTWAFEYFPYTRLELIQADLGLGLVSSAWRWYRSNLHTIRHKKSLKDLRAFFDTCTLEQPLGTHSSRASGPSTRTPRRRPMTDPTSSTPVEGPSRAGPNRSAGPSRAPRSISESTGPLLPGLANLRLPYSIPYYPPDVTLAFREVSLESVDRLDLPPEDITEVPIGLVSQIMELILGMQQELTSSWTLRAFDDQRGRRPRR
ncbi:hypothetical protein JCGZ_22089 [Jatropha curcas]|uniref:Aminotransferase-like plant mobile domain-containing protein n=1 Tax=Jatropha curcas TaxID=180498 RepID=A0A067K5C0_JATCU|nr:hypothetical protein JCGZ_22089 [Jatropha curcas]